MSETAAAAASAAVAIRTVASRNAKMVIPVFEEKCRTSLGLLESTVNELLYPFRHRTTIPVSLRMNTLALDDVVLYSTTYVNSVVLKVGQ